MSCDRPQKLPPTPSRNFINAQDDPIAFAKECLRGPLPDTARIWIVYASVRQFEFEDECRAYLREREASR